MTGDARRALTRLLNAFENHFDIARDGDEADDAALEAAELALRDAFFTYDDILFTQLGVELPFDILDEIDEDDYDEDDEDYDDEDEDEDDYDYEDDDEELDDEELYEVTCPSCGDTICVTEDMLDEGSVNCPNCGELLEFDFDDECDCGDDDCGCGCGHDHDHE